MLRKTRIDLRNLLKEPEFKTIGRSSDDTEPNSDGSKTNQERPDTERHDQEPVREEPAKHLPRPTRR
jgi:hypothetical protein